LLDGWSEINKNLFVGFGNNPVGRLDPFGLCADGLPAGSDPFNAPQTLKLATELAEDAGEIAPKAERAAEAARKVAQAAKQGAKSYEKWLEHQQKLKAAQERLLKLKKLLEKTKGPKAQEPIKEAIKDLEKSIKGHIKEIGQKWPKGCPAQ
jgi:hypothetical protein